MLARAAGPLTDGRFKLLLKVIHFRLTLLVRVTRRISLCKQGTASFQQRVYGADNLVLRQSGPHLFFRSTPIELRAENKHLRKPALDLSATHGKVSGVIWVEPAQGRQTCDGHGMFEDGCVNLNTIEVALRPSHVF